MNETESGALPGLSEEEAALRLQQEGYNELPSSKRRSTAAIALEVIREPMFLLLVACGAIYLLLGDLQEALMLLGFVLVFSKEVLALSLLQGVIVLGIVLAVYLVALFRGQGEEDARTLAFSSLIIANLALIMTNRSWSHTALATLRSPNAALWWVVGGAMSFLGLVLSIPALRALFHFSKLHPLDLALCLASGIAGILWFEILIVYRLRRQRSMICC